MIDLARSQVNASTLCSNGIRKGWCQQRKDFVRNPPLERLAFGLLRAKHDAVETRFVELDSLALVVIVRVEGWYVQHTNPWWHSLASNLSTFWWIDRSQSIHVLVDRSIAIDDRRSPENLEVER